MVRFYCPAVEELRYRSLLLSDEQTMSYNARWGGTIDFPEEKWPAWHSRWTEDGSRFYRYIADDTGRFVGEAAMHPVDGQETVSIIIHASERGKGFGRAALRLLYDEARRNGITELFDSVAADNEAALHLFFSEGFEETGRDGQAVLLRKILPKQTDYPLLLKRVVAVTDGIPHPTANLANASALLYDAMDRLNWAGFYLLRGNTLVLGPFQGKPACIEIPVGKGVCGTAIASGETQLVSDVHRFPGHIACDSASNSEIVVPLRQNGKLIGVLDIDSPDIARFNQDDRDYLEQFAGLLCRAVITGGQE